MPVTAGTRLWRYTWTFGRSRPQASSAATSRRERSRRAAGSGRLARACRAGTRAGRARALPGGVGAGGGAGGRGGAEPPRALAQRRRIGAAVERVQVGNEDVHVA